MDNEISKEINQHGSNWGKLHNGYFTDVNVAAPLIGKIKSAIAISKPQAVVDLGGGTGFILSELTKNNIPTAIRLVNIDVSGKQLKNLKNKRIETICGSLADFKRSDIRNKSTILFIMRSALHYFGRDGLSPTLNHLRKQTEKGEFFIHQTACFERQEDADRINKIYRMMGTGKWYPTVYQLSSLLETAGWKIESSLSAPKLPLACNDLTERYNLSSQTVLKICNEISKYSSRTENTDNGLWGYLHYKIFTCVAG